MNEEILEQIEILEEQIRICKQILDNTDYQAIKYAEGILTEEEFSESKTKREEMRTNINNYELEIETLLNNE